MRLFWILIAAFMLVGGLVLGVSWFGQRRAAQRAFDEAMRAEEAARLLAAQPAAQEPVATPPSVPVVEPAPAPPPAAEVTPAIVSPATTTPEAPITPVPDAKPVPAPTPAPKPAPAPAAPEAVVATPTTLPAPLPATLGTWEVAAATFALKDGAMLVDDKYIVRGEGTAENPYQVTWEMLASVGNAFDPRAGRKAIPGRVAFLEGKVVRLSGYVSFPLMVKQPRELLAMLNQWDGCCIGVPPTPYDAIEVSLAKPILGNDAMAIAGSITGTFHVKPYVVGDWLVGLYVMEQGSLVASDWSAAGGF